MVEGQAGYRRGIVKAQSEGVNETAKRFKALERTREAGTAQGYGAVVPGLILGYKTPTLKHALIFSHAGAVLKFESTFADAATVSLPGKIPDYISLYNKDPRRTTIRLSMLNVSRMKLCHLLLFIRVPAAESIHP